VILLVVILLAFLAIPVVVALRARVATLTGVQLTLCWAVALLPSSVAWWAVNLDRGEWIYTVAGPDWLGPLLLLILFLVVTLLLVSLPVGAATATVLWVIARSRRADVPSSRLR
jgi:hypothetical protein